MWQPTASLSAIKQRAELYRKIRAYFADNDVLEVETPLLSEYTVPDPHIFSLQTALFDKIYYLQTSPEFHMKRLLAAGTGCIFQIGKAFRKDEAGKYHNPEFTILEWYRINFDLSQLMADMDKFLQFILSAQPANYFTYQEVFLKFLAIDPLESSDQQLINCLQQKNINITNLINLDRDDYLHLLMSYCIEPQLNQPNTPYFIYNYPTSQAALAKQCSHDARIAARFEVYIHCIELANGFHELNNAHEQRQRFIENNLRRQKEHSPTIPLDENFLTALNYLPNCSGVALGIDRLLIILLQQQQLTDVISFPIDIA